jgi:PTS system nitrogen regulatory IIA component
MNLEILAKNACVWDKSVSKNFALGSLFETLAESVIAFDRMNAWKEIQKREALASSYMGNEFVLCHARIPEIKMPLLALGICPPGITGAGAPPGETVRILGVLLSPSQFPNAHIYALRELSSRILNPEWKQRFLASLTPQDLVQIFDSFFKNGRPIKDK